MKTLFFVVMLFFANLVYSQTVKFDIFSTAILETENNNFINPYQLIEDGAFVFEMPLESVYHIEMDLSTGIVRFNHFGERVFNYSVKKEGSLLIFTDGDNVGGCVVSLDPGYEKVCIFLTDENGKKTYYIGKNFIVTYPL